LFVRPAQDTFLDVLGDFIISNRVLPNERAFTQCVCATAPDGVVEWEQLHLLLPVRRRKNSGFDRLFIWFLKLSASVKPIIPSHKAGHLSG
jgi:hypothetical protein